MAGHQRTPSTSLARPNSLRSGATSVTSSSRSSSPAKPPPSASSMLSPPGRSSPHTSRLVPPSSPVKRIPSLSLQPRKSFPRQSTLDGAPPSPSVPTARSLVPPPSSSPSHETSIAAPTPRKTILPFAPQTSSPQPQPQILRRSPVSEAVPLPPAQITPSSSLASASAHAAPSFTLGPGHTRAVSMTREPSSPIATVCLNFISHSILLTRHAA